VLARSLPFYWMSVLTAATNQLPLLFLVERAGQSQVGLYNAGLRLTYPLQVILESALTALYPGLSRTAATDPARYVNMLRRALLGLTMLGVAGATSLSLIRHEVVVLLFGPAFGPSADALAFQCWFSVLYATLSLIGTSLAASDRQRQLAALSTAYAVIATPILWFGAGLGATGLAAAILLAAAVNMTYHWLAFQRSLPKRVPPGFLLRLALIAAAGLSVAWGVPSDWLLGVRLSIAALLSGVCLTAVVVNRAPPLTGYAPAG
jgi:O-antigen/teichoic acid export membrane protein